MLWTENIYGSCCAMPVNVNAVKCQVKIEVKSKWIEFYRISLTLFGTVDSLQAIYVSVKSGCNWNLPFFFFRAMLIYDFIFFFSYVTLIGFGRVAGTVLTFTMKRVRDRDGDRVEMVFGRCCLCNLKLQHRCAMGRWAPVRMCKHANEGISRYDARVNMETRFIFFVAFCISFPLPIEWCSALTM